MFFFYRNLSENKIWNIPDRTYDGEELERTGWADTDRSRLNEKGNSTWWYIFELCIVYVTLTVAK